MSVYAKETPQRLDRALRSVWDDQIVRPDEIVLVEDGPLPPKLRRTIQKWQKDLSDRFVVVRLPENVGLGPALQKGLEACRYRLIARMDSDDISVPQRFLEQLKVFENGDIDVCGSWVAEFESDPATILGIRKVPRHHKEIEQFAKWRSPLNHPSVMFRKESVAEVGGYRAFEGFEDYDLWVRFLLAGKRVYNIQEPLVLMQADSGQINRRRGWRYAMQEVKFWKEAKDLGFVSGFEALRNIMLRSLLRCLPASFLQKLYRKFLRSRIRLPLS